MNELLTEIITEISIYSVFVPIIFGIKGFKKNPFILNVFLAYLCYGGVIDIFSDYIYEANVISNSFTFVQVLFFTWFLYQVINQKKLFKVYVILSSFWAVLYFFCHLYLLDDWQLLKLSSLFDTMAVIVTSFIAAAALVNMVKDEMELTKNPIFWFTLAVFFYTFCTYFIVSFIANVSYREKLWWIHNLANICAYFIYAYGFWLSSKKPVSQ